MEELHCSIGVGFGISMGIRLGFVGLEALRLLTLFDGTMTAGTLGFSGLARGIGAELSGNAGMIDQMSVADTR
jgi:hypothetical protein